MPKINFSAIAFYVALPFIYFVSLLPFRVLYLISDVVLYPILYLLLGYRKKVVSENLRNAFPEKSDKERREIEKRFYHFLCDLFLETLKCITISEKELKKRFVYKYDLALVDKWYKENRSFVVTMGHYGNYEFIAQSLGSGFGRHNGTGPYHELSNPFFDKLFYQMRIKFGTEMYPTHRTFKRIMEGFERPSVIGLANDQSAPPQNSFWTTFLNQDTSFFKGTESIARKFNMPVMFGEVNRVKRGFYVASFQLITENPKQEPEGYILERHARLLEQVIIDKPDFWLWSHRRWKHKRPS